MPKPTEEQLKKWEAVNRIFSDLIDRGEMGRLEEAALDGKDAVKRTLSPLLDKKDWPHLDAVTDEIIEVQKLPDLDEAIRRARSPDVDKLNRNEAASSLSDIERRERIFSKLRDEGLVPPQTDAKKAEVAVEKAAAAASDKAKKIAKFVSPDEVRALGAENAQFLANVRDPESPLGEAFTQDAAKKLVKVIQERSKGTSINLHSESSAAVSEHGGGQETIIESHAVKAKISPAAASHLKGGLAGLAGAGGAMAVAAYQAPEGQKLNAAIGAGADSIAPGSSAAGTNGCKITGVVAGNVAGFLVAAPVGAAAFAGGTALSTPVVGPAAPAVGAAVAAAAGGTSFEVTRRSVSGLSEEACNAASDALKKVASALSFGGSDKVAQNQHKEVVADTGNAIKK